MHLRWITENRIFRKIQHHPKLLLRRIEPTTELDYIASIAQDIEYKLKLNAVKVRLNTFDGMIDIVFHTRSQQRMFHDEFMDYIINDYIVGKHKYHMTWSNND